MDDYLVTQSEAKDMLRAIGCSRRSAYYQLDNVPSRLDHGIKWYARIDVEVLREKITRKATRTAETARVAE